MPTGGVSTGTDSTTAASAGGNEDFPEVDAFLGSINLQKYKERFIENGIEDEETILELNDSHLDAIGIPLGYKLKIIKRIKMIRQEKGMSVPESRQGQRPKADNQSNVGSEVREATTQDYTELPAPKSPTKSALKNSQRAEGAS